MWSEEPDITKVMFNTEEPDITKVMFNTLKE